MGIYIGILVIFLAGFVVLACGLYARWKYAPEKWQQSHAVVTHSEAMPRLAKTPTYAPYIRYRYQVNGATYDGDTYAFSSAEDLGNLANTNKLLLPYAKGSTIHIWHQILNPSVSCIKLNSSYSRSQMSALIVGGILVISMGIAVLIMSQA